MEWLIYLHVVSNQPKTEPEAWAPKATHERASDRLLSRIAEVGAPVCVGLDPVLQLMPKELLRRFDDPTDDALAASVLSKFCLGVLEAIKGIVPIVKVQAACFERHGADGLRVLSQVLAAANRDFETIFDGKRGDIGVTAEHYAHGARNALRADWSTVNCYLGMDGISPFVGQDGAGDWHGAFALVRTSNPSGDLLQTLPLRDGRLVCHAVADMVAAAGVNSVGKRGYSDLGAVVGATKRDDIVELRRRMPQQMFLVPGFGAQGAGVDDVLPCFNPDGTGAVIAASRSIIYAFEPTDVDWQDAIGRAAKEFHAAVARGLDSGAFR